MYSQCRKMTVSKQKRGHNSMKPEVSRQIDELGRVVLPKEIRKLYGFKPGDTVYFTTQDNGILIHSKGYWYEHTKDDK